MRALPRSIKGYTAFIDGFGMIGLTTGGKLPPIKAKTEAYRDGGMDGEDELEFGIEKLEAELTFSEMNERVLGAVLSRNTPITLRGSMEGEGGSAVVPVIGQMRGLVTSADPGEWGDPKKGEVKLALTPNYYRLRIGSAEIYEIDLLNGIRRINGTDQLAARRAALGV
ncbi:phage major tail tube protein [Brevundimonas sp.]|uniref:phage major tail tube protein n=1 Tax=Brevundimonas sp. TaxID=1871086 RepID=UPI0025C34578|nr:phage major tail tube protein [Brevundimonas sp.]MCG2663351.1 phage major tail tube protein [Brevundimonas sp.]